MPDSDEWRSRIVDDRAGIARVVNSVSRIAVIGIKTEAAGGPAYYVPEITQQSGFTIIPVPVYHPEATEILGEPVHRSLATIDPPADMVQLFRRSSDVPKHVDEILAAKPKVVWMQLGIRNDEAAEQFAKAGITVIQDKCLKVELQRLGR
ncbi:MAG: CoA-binding protein [Gemmatimonadota bacterium]